MGQNKGRGWNRDHYPSWSYMSYVSDCLIWVDFVPLLTSSWRGSAVELCGSLMTWCCGLGRASGASSPDGSIIAWGWVRGWTFRPVMKPQRGYQKHRNIPGRNHYHYHQNLKSSGLLTWPDPWVPPGTNCLDLWVPDLTVTLWFLWIQLKAVNWRWLKKKSDHWGLKQVESRSPYRYKSLIYGKYMGWELIENCLVVIIITLWCRDWPFCFCLCE